MCPSEHMAEGGAVVTAPSSQDYVPFYDPPAASAVDSVRAPAKQAEIPFKYDTRTPSTSGSVTNEIHRERTRWGLTQKERRPGGGWLSPDRHQGWWRRLLLNHWPIPNPRAPCETSRHVTDNVWLILFSANIMKMKFNVMYIYMNPKGAVMQDATGQVLVRLIHGLLLSTCMRMSVHTLPTHRWDLRFAPAHGILIKATDAEELWLEYYRTDHYKECPLELSSLIISFISNICFQIEHMF